MLFFRSREFVTRGKQGQSFQLISQRHYWHMVGQE
jgi:hypothetical protein